MFIDLSSPRWDTFFKDVCAIETTGESAVNDLGEMASEPQPLEGHGAIECQVTTKSGKIEGASGHVIDVTTTEIGLRGFFPQIKSGMTAIARGTRYKITGTPSDSQSVKTRLIVEAIN